MNYHVYFSPPGARNGLSDMQERLFRERKLTFPGKFSRWK